MHICLVTHDIGSSCCGIARYGDILGEGLRGLGHRLTVVTPSIHGLPVRDDAMRVYTVGAPSWDSTHGNRISRRSRYRKKIVELAASNRFDVLHFIQAEDIGGGYTIGCPVIGEVHEYVFLDTPPFPWALRSLSKNWIKDWIYQRIVRRMLLRGIRHADMIVTHCRYVSGRIERHIPGANIRRVPLSIYDPASKDPAAERRRYIHSDHKPTVLFIGNIFQRKGLPVLMNALRRIAQKGIHPCLKVAGRDPDIPGYEKIAETMGIAAEFLGHVPNEKMAGLFETADLLVLPSHEEGSPVVLLEAMKHAVPIIATRVGGIPEMVKEGENGFCIEENDEEILAERIVRLIQDRGLNISMGLRGLHLSRTYDFTQMARLVEAAYGEAHESFSATDGMDE